MSTNIPWDDGSIIIIEGKEDGRIEKLKESLKRVAPSLALNTYCLPDNSLRLTVELDVMLSNEIRSVIIDILEKSQCTIKIQPK